MTNSNFPINNSKQPISEQEQEILKYWQEKNIFQRSIESRNPAFPYTFFDGPPFATGTPHYGHILAGTIKDAIPRYKTMQGYQVKRKWGWDCHGVPVEFQVEKEYQIGGKPGIEKMGVGKFNELCRSVVLRCADQWKETVARMGRFVDFENDYKTMDPTFMESVWWVFNQLWEKGFIYEGEKVVAYSPKLGSPLSNFEANLNYTDIDDPAITARFKIIDKKLCAKAPTYFLAWTTTPWTLPSNLALCVNPKLEYAVVEKDGHNYILAENLVQKFFGEEAKINLKFPGKKLVGTKYEPLFPFFKTHKNAFQVLADDFVSSSDGTGIVHMAPNFGEEDARICESNGIMYLNPCPIDENGYFSSSAPLSGGKSAEELWHGTKEKKSQENSSYSFDKGIKGLYFRRDKEVPGSEKNNANKWVLHVLKNTGKIFEQKQIKHSYPHCWRTDCALMYRGIKTWFVNIQKIKEKMISENQNINWIPNHLKDGRFGKMLETAPDWAISRNRYWGCPIPVWKCTKCKHTQVVSSRSELETLCGKNVDDLHKHFVDKFTWDCEKCKKNPGKMKRIEEVLDCWFESGAMPYASVHYPFNQQCSEKNPKLSNEFFIARHGQADNNVLEIASCTEETQKQHGLTDLGREQVKSSAKKYSKFDVIVTSPYRRTQETAEIFAKYNNAKIINDSRLREIDHPSFDGTHTSNFEKWEEENSDISVPYPNGENLHDLEERMLEVFTDINKKFSGKKILFVSHGLCVQAALDVFKGNCQQRWKGEIKNAEVHQLKLSPPKIPEKLEFQSANFIAEGLDQTRGWFYTLQVLGCALFEKNIYKNVITNGIILAEDGQKMSKSKKNYPDPNLIFDTYGADAMRFYLLNSPAVRGENFRFTEQGVEEVLKSILLPLKSTYQFLSTYANIDTWNPTKFVFVRHGEGDHTIQKIYSGKVTNKHHLTDLGKAQIEEITPFLPPFDLLISSPFIRTKETAKLIKKISGFSGEIQIDKRIQEADFGNCEGKKWIPSLERYKNKSTEHPFQVQERVDEFIEEMNQKNKGKTILISTHGSPVRSAETYQSHTKNLDDLVRIPYPETGKYRIIFAHPDAKNELDQWILSELQTLVKGYRENFEKYNLEGALRLVAPFIDNLNNWYLRRSRRRFWANGMSDDKVSGYETLHHVLLILSKILAPVCPFFSEKLFQDLGGAGSVHLEYMPHHNERWIKQEEQEKVSLTREIVSLAAGIRARAKIKLRQPLAVLQVSTTSASKIDIDIIKAEANVKKVTIIPEKELKKLAQKIVRVKARMVGKKFGSKVQELIKAGKEGLFLEKENGIIEICGETLFPDEYEIGFVTEEGVEAESTVRTVVLLDTELTENLILEGYAREIIRAIQEMRKTNKFEIADRIKIVYESNSEKIIKALNQFNKKICDETLTTNISCKKNNGPKIEIEGEIINLKIDKFLK